MECLVRFYFFSLYRVNRLDSKKSDQSVESKANLVFDNLKVYKQITNVSVSFLSLLLVPVFTTSPQQFFCVDVNEATVSATPINSLNIFAQ